MSELDHEVVNNLQAESSLRHKVFGKERMVETARNPATESTTQEFIDIIHALCGHDAEDTELLRTKFLVRERGLPIEIKAYLTPDADAKWSEDVLDRPFAAVLGAKIEKGLMKPPHSHLGYYAMYESVFVGLDGRARIDRRYLHRGQVKIMANKFATEIEVNSAIETALESVRQNERIRNPGRNYNLQDDLSVLPASFQDSIPDGSEAFQPDAPEA